jgi:N,N'-diacetylchitobiose phosphorylase
MNAKNEFQPGYFDPRTNEYCLGDPRTPMPWMHYLLNDEYVALVSVTGGGYSFHKSARFKRILRMRPNNVPFDRPGRYVYIKNEDTGDFHSVGWAPVMKSLDKQTYSCRLGAGYMRIESGYENLESSLTFFVPPADNLEIWRCTIKNKNNRRQALSVFPYAEFALFDATNDRDNYQYTYNIATCAGESNFIFHETLYGITGFLAYFASSIAPEDFECDRERFIGPYNTEANPTGLLRGKLTDLPASGGNPCAAQRIRLSLEPGETKEIVFVLGVADTREEAKSAAQKYFTAKTLDSAFEETLSGWNEIFGKFAIATPDIEVNTIINFWHPYQIRTTLALSRGPSIYEGGINRGIGYRDSNQDSLGPVYQVPGRVRKLITDLLGFQLADGHAWHGYFPGKKEGFGEKYSDDHLWLLLSVSNYARETGDISILDEKLPYFDSAKEESVFDHLRRALDFTAGDLGNHEIPHMQNADWNDCLNLNGPKNASESVWSGMLFHKALLDFIDICSASGKKDPIPEAERHASAIRKNIYKHAFNGKWFLRGFDDDGGPIGSEKNKYAKIFLNPQSWSVYSGIAGRNDGITAMDSVKEKLDTEYGVNLLWPAYREVDRSVGAISSFPPGLKENGGIFCHSNTWVVIAECMLGRGDLAYAYYRKLLPTEFNKRASLHKAEPYIYSQVIAGKEHPDFGLARNSWLTGTASWMFVAFTQYILGIRPDFEGIVIDPCLPGSWNGYKAKRKLRNAVYNFEVSNPDAVNTGIKSMTVDGKEIDGNVIPYAKSGEVKVEVVLGK